MQPAPLRSTLNRSARRKVGAFLRAHIDKRKHVHWAQCGLCEYVLVATEEAPTRALVEALDTLSRDIGVAVSSGWSCLLPPSLVFGHTPLHEAGRDYPTDAESARIRRSWLRHWEETGEILVHETWVAREKARALASKSRRIARKADELAEKLDAQSTFEGEITCA